MASLMLICAGLVGPKSENVEKPLVFVFFLKGQGRPDESRKTNKPAATTHREVEKVDFWFKMLCVDVGNGASCLGREHIFVKIVKKYGRTVKHAPKKP